MVDVSLLDTTQNAHVPSAFERQGRPQAQARQEYVTAEMKEELPQEMRLHLLKKFRSKRDIFTYIDVHSKFELPTAYFISKSTI